MFIEGIMQHGVHKLVSPKEFKVSLIRKEEMLHWIPCLCSIQVAFHLPSQKNKITPAVFLLVNHIIIVTQSKHFPADMHKPIYLLFENVCLHLYMAYY